MQEYDLVIVGGGPAGLTAGLYASRAKLKAVLIEKKRLGGQLLNTEWIEDYPGFERIRGVELAQRMENQVRKLGLQIEYDGVKCVKRHGIHKLVQLESGKEILAKAVIVTAGGEPRKLGVPGEDEFMGRGVSYCAICDGAFYQDQEIAVVGGGDSAIEEALFLTRYASKVHIIHRRSAFRAQSVLMDRAKANPKIQFHRDTTVEAIHGSEGVDYITIRRDDRRQRLDVTGVFIFVGFIPNTDLFCGHVEHDRYGYVITDANMATSTKGIYAAGDIRSQVTHQITTAVGDGTTAAIAAERYIEGMPERLEIAWSA
ncbi:MAG: thioredoxin-disulfide reductase [Chloroflexota bacterium]|jgi:thioredoxin reductase (NADPH)